MTTDGTQQQYSYWAHEDGFGAVEDTLRQKAEGSGRFTVYNFFAPSRFGKSTLLQRIWDTYESLLPISFVSVSEFHQDKQSHLGKILEQMAGHLSERLPPRLTGEIEASSPAHNGDVALASRLVKLIHASSQFDKNVLLLLDDYDEMSLIDRRLFEANVLGPASSVPLLTVILTSQTKLRFDRIDLQTRLHSRRLTSLSEEDISRSYPEYSPVVKKLRNLSGGIPDLISRLIDELKATNVSAEEFDENEHLLSREQYAKLVSETILKDIPSELKETVQILAILRRYDVPVLRLVLRSMLPSTYRSYNTTDYLNLIGRLAAWSEWRLQGGWCVNRAYQIVLKKYVDSNQPRLFRRVNRTIADYYSDLLRSEFKEHYLTELVFHEATLLKLAGRGPRDVRDEVSQMVVDILSQQVDAEPQVDIDSLRNTLVHDSDLQSFISLKAQNELQQMAARQLERQLEGGRILALFQSDQ